LRKGQGLSRSRLAFVADLDDYLVAAIERGEHDPSYDSLLSLAEALDETPTALIARAARVSEHFADARACPEKTS